MGDAYVGVKGKILSNQSSEIEVLKIFLPVLQQGADASESHAQSKLRRCPCQIFVDGTCFAGSSGHGTDPKRGAEGFAQKGDGFEEVSRVGVEEGFVVEPLKAFGRGYLGLGRHGNMVGFAIFHMKLLDYHAFLRESIDKTFDG